MNTLKFLRANEFKGENSFLVEAQYLKDNWEWLKYSYAIAIKVRSRMTELGITQKQLAEMLDCTQQHISVLLNGRVNMTLETIAKLENALNLKIIGGELKANSYPSNEFTNRFLNAPGPEEKTEGIQTSNMVDGYTPRKKKGPKKKPAAR